MMGRLLYRARQKWMYHTSADPLTKKIAEINRSEELVIRKGSKFFVRNVPLEFSLQRHGFILDQITLFEKLAAHGSFSFDNDILCYQFQGLTFSITTAEEIFIINEIFFERTYTFVGPDEYCVIDIGMNVGFASLYFAQDKRVKKVYAFEPFKPTYEQAARNFKRNPGVSAKITSFNFGLSDHSATIDVDYNYENKGQVGIDGTRLIKSQIGTAERASIKLEEASGQIQNIIQQHPMDRIMLKVDCEGSEYAIFRDLQSHQLFDRIDVIILEWHEKGPDELLQILLQNNFKSFSQQSMDRKVGMIYAAK